LIRGSTFVDFSVTSSACSTSMTCLGNRL